MSAVMWDYDLDNLEMGQSFSVVSGKLPSDALSSYFESDFEKKWNNIIDSLIAIRSLHDNWDGEDSEAPAPELVDSILEYIFSLRASNVPSPSRASASPNGEIVLEWQEKNSYLEADFGEPYTIEWMKKEGDLPAVHWIERFGQEQINEYDYFLSRLSPADN